MTTEAASSESHARPTPRRRMNAEAFLAYPWPEGTRAELLYGEVVMSPSPTGGHQRHCRDLSHWLLKLDPEMKAGEVLPAPMDVRLPNGHVVQPDLLVRDWETPMPNDRYVDGAPLLVVEVLSSNRKFDEVRKFEIYLGAGVREYWIVDPDVPALAIYVLDNETGHYAHQDADDAGYVFSPQYARHLRLVQDEAIRGSRLEWREATGKKG